MPLFCRHNRFTADCPICSKGTALADERPAAPRRSGRQSPRKAGGAAGRGGRRGADAGARVYSGRHVACGPYRDGEDAYDVRLERVPGGLRLAEWAAGSLRRRAPVLAAGDLATLLSEAVTASVAEEDALRPAMVARPPVDGPDGPAFGASAGRSGELRDELRVERLEGGPPRLRIGRWLLRPGTGWELQEAPPMLPAARFGEAVASAVERGVMPALSEATGTARP